MDSIPIKEAIAFGTWYECHAIQYDKPINFRMRLLGFRQTSFAEHYASPTNWQSEGVLWMLSFDIVNVNKSALNCDSASGVMQLTDEQSDIHRF